MILARTSSKTSSLLIKSTKTISSLLVAALCCVGAVSESAAANKVTNKQLSSNTGKSAIKSAQISKQAKLPKKSTSLISLVRLEAQTNIAAAFAIEKGAVHTLMPKHRGHKVLNIGRYSKTVRTSLIEALNTTARGSSYEINFSTIAPQERVAIVRELLAGRANSAAAYENAAEFASVHMADTVIEYRAGSRVLSYTAKSAL